jgi:hypothetical protein
MQFKPIDLSQVPDALLAEIIKSALVERERAVSALEKQTESAKRTYMRHCPRRRLKRS